MLYFILEVIGVSIMVSLFATWTKLIPRYPKRRHVFIQQLINTGILTILLTILFILGIYPSWFLMFALILLILWLSVRITSAIVQKGLGSQEEQNS